MSKETIDPYHRLQILPNPDGTFTRLIGNAVPNTAPSSDPSLPISVLTKDITINPHNHTWLRLFLPRSLLSSSNPNKLPLIVFFHGSGFVLLSAASCVFHDFCIQITDSAQAIVASVEYRLAPEHRRRRPTTTAQKRCGGSQTAKMSGCVNTRIIPSVILWGTALEPLSLTTQVTLLLLHLNPL